MTTAWTLALAEAPHSRVTVGGVHIALMSAWLLHEAWQFAEALHIGGVISPSHFGAVAVPVQPPLQLTLAPHMMLAFASSLQLPVHLPWQEPSQ